MTKQEGTTYLVLVSLIVGIIAFGGMVYNFQNADEIGFHTHPTHLTMQDLTEPEPFDDSDILQSLANIDNTLIDQRAEYTREIVQVKKDLSLAQIGTGDQQKDKLKEQTGTGTSPKITIHLDSNEYIRGEIIWISGTADPLQPVQATVKDPNFKTRTPNASADSRGLFKVALTTNFDSILGTYTVFVRSQGEVSQTLSFVLKQ